MSQVQIPHEKFIQVNILTRRPSIVCVDRYVLYGVPVMRFILFIIPTGTDSTVLVLYDTTRVLRTDAGSIFHWIYYCQFKVTVSTYSTC